MALEFIVAGHYRYDDSGAVQSTLVKVVNGQRTISYDDDDVNKYE